MKPAGRNEKFLLEYVIRSSRPILWEFLSTPSGLSEWFADKVDQRNAEIIFAWEGTTQRAQIIDQMPEQYIRFRWEGAKEDEYFEFRILISDVTGDTILQITDFANASELEDARKLWDQQIHDLKKRLGSL